MGKSVIVIGAGIAGLAASIRLAKKGFVVTVFEANDYPGGKLTEVRLGDYRFDTSPSFLTLPEEIDELYRLCGLDVNNHFEYKKLESIGKHFYADGIVLQAHADRNRLIEEIKEKTLEPVENTERILNSSAQRYNEYSSRFLNRSLPKSRILRMAMAWKYDFQQSGTNRSIHQVNKHKLKESKAIQLFNEYASSHGSNPRQTPNAFNIHPHIRLALGTYFPSKGMQSIPDSLYRLAKSAGVKFQFSTPVEKIVVYEGKAKGVNTRMGFHKSDRVVSNMDVLATYNHLLKESHSRGKLSRQSRSSSILTFFWGVRNKFSDLVLQNTFYSENPETEFEHIYELNRAYSDPTINLKITSVEKSDDAPQGCQNWAVTIKVPHNSGQDWDKLIAEARVNILKKLSAMLNTDIEPLIEVEKILDPRLIEEKTAAWQGALFGPNKHHKYAPFRRYPNESKSVRHLYFCGSSVHPGGGIPMCLQSAKIMTQNFK